MKQLNYNILKKHFNRKELRTVHYHTIWFIRTFCIESMQYPGIKYRHLVVPFRIILFVANKLFRRQMTLPRESHLTLDAPKRGIFYGTRKSLAVYQNQLRDGAVGFNMMGEILGIDGEIFIEPYFDTHGKYMTLHIEGAPVDVIKTLCMRRKDSVWGLSTHERIGKLSIPTSIYRKRYGVTFPDPPWEQIRCLSDILAMTYMNTLFLNNSLFSIPYTILEGTMLNYLPTDSYYRKNKRSLITQMNRFCKRIGIPDIFEYKDIEG